MSDIVERLRNGAPDYSENGENADALALDWWEDQTGPKAADEITRLREANKELVTVLQHAQDIIGHPDCPSSLLIAETIEKHKGG